MAGPHARPSIRGTRNTAHGGCEREKHVRVAAVVQKTTRACETDGMAGPGRAHDRMRACRCPCWVAVGVGEGGARGSIDPSEHRAYGVV